MAGVAGLQASWLQVQVHTQSTWWLLLTAFLHPRPPPFDSSFQACACWFHHSPMALPAFLMCSSPTQAHPQALLNCTTFAMTRYTRAVSASAFYSDTARGHLMNSSLPEACTFGRPPNAAIFWFQPVPISVATFWLHMLHELNLSYHLYNYVGLYSQHTYPVPLDTQILFC